MSGIGRKRISKWDLKEESQLSVENVQDRSWPGRMGISFHEKETESGYEDYGMRMSPGLDEWRKQRHHHSPKNEWNRSRRSGSWSRSRSRSRSPVRGFRRESGVPGRSRNRSGSTQLCRDFSAGKCRRGNHCPFYHQGSQNYEDGWENRQRKPGGSNYSPPHDSREYPERSGRSLDCCSEFLKGRCRRGESCRYAHHGSSDVFDKVSGDDVIRERENDRRRRDVSLEWSGEPKSRRSTDVTCKFFAAGNCRNGKYCRFSHHGPARVSPDERSRDNRLFQGRNAEDVESSQNVSKWGDTHTFPNSAKWNDDKNKVTHAPESGFTAWPTSSGWGRHDFDNRDTKDSDKAAADDKKEGLHWTAENASAGVCASEPKGGDNWLGDMEMSPDWNYKEQPSKNSMKEEEGSVVRSLQSLIPTEPTHDPDINHGVSGRLYDTSSVMQPMAVERSALNLDLNMREGGTVALPCNDISATGKIPTSCIDLNYNMNILPGQGFEHDIQSSNVAPFSSVSAIGKSQMALPSDPSGGGNIINHPNHAASLDETPSKKLEIGDVSLSQVNSGIVPSQNMVSSEQFNSLSVSLAHILANGQQLPQIYASLSSHNATDPPAIAKTERPTEPGSAASSQPNQVMGDGKQYDPLFDSIDAKKHNVSSGQLRILPSPDLRKCIVDSEPQISSERLGHSSFTVGTNVNDNNKVQDEPGKITEITKETNAMVAEESNKIGEQGEVQQDNGSGAKVEGDAKTGEGKKIKDIKGMRTFKFALVEFVKEILKPTWKEGQMSKDAYKNIVKKVVDKVTSTLQGSSVPQTQEKIDQYLSFSKPKLNKLIQAYVEKIQKAS